MSALTTLDIPPRSEATSHAETLLRRRGAYSPTVHYVYSAGDPEAGWFCGRPCDTVLFVERGEAQTAFVWTEPVTDKESNTCVETIDGWVSHE